jgi:DNA-binding IclR family transcriptional regulator
MLDGEIIANVIGMIQDHNAITVLQISLRFDIPPEKAERLLIELENCGFLERFDDFYARVDCVSFN